MELLLLKKSVIHLVLAVTQTVDSALQEVSAEVLQVFVMFKKYAMVLTIIALQTISATLVKLVRLPILASLLDIVLKEHVLELINSVWGYAVTLYWQQVKNVILLEIAVAAPANSSLNPLCVEI